MTRMQTLTAALVTATALLLGGCAQTTQAQAINLYQPEWGLDSYEQGMRAYEHGDVEAAARYFKDAYTFSDAKAEAMLGILYLKGEGVFQNAEVARAYAIAADQRSDFDAFDYYQQRWNASNESDSAYLIAWVLANRFSGQARTDYEKWIRLAAEAGHSEAQKDVVKYLN
ncbi:MAG: hypothetical protein OXT49_02390 [Gammaproteobacteria bacterium]|nr:hypothetical protein [Gammaproteobacteria bacterium]